MIKYYETFYKTFPVHSDRQLLWSHMFGEMQLTFSPRRKGKTKKYIVTMSPLQAYLCLSFRSFDHILSAKELNQMLNYDGEKDQPCSVDRAKKLKRVLAALTFAKKKMLICTVNGKKEKKKFSNINESLIQCNIKFENAKTKFSIPSNTFAAKKLVAKVKEDRKITIDACLVRIMKAATVKTQNELISEVLQQLTTFAVEKRDIKPRIEHLINEEFFERDEDDQNVLHYLA